MGAKQAALAGAGVAILVALKLLKKKFDDKYGGLDSAVSYSAKKIAGARARAGSLSLPRLPKITPRP